MIILVETDHMIVLVEILFYSISQICLYDHIGKSTNS